MDGRRIAVVALAGALVLGGCSGDADEPAAGPSPSASPSDGPSPDSSASPSPGDPTAGPGVLPADFTVTGIDCGLLDTRLDVPGSTGAQGPDAEADAFAAGDLCLGNALRTGQAATFRLVSATMEGDPVFASFVVDGIGSLTITEDHRGVLVSDIDRRTKTCTAARGLNNQGACEVVEEPRE